MIAPSPDIEIEAVRRPYDVEIVPEMVGHELVFVARHPELPGCMSHGSTPEEALEMLDDARELYLEGLREAGVAIPPAKTDPRSVVLVPGIFKAGIEAPHVRQTPWRRVFEIG
jgi:predicted RNase H-like HicB family nuclease